MRTDILHHRIVRDIEVMIDAIDDVLPVKMPLQYEKRTMNLGSFVKRLNGATEACNVFNEICVDETLQKSALVTSGFWYPEEDRIEDGNPADVRIFWHTHPDCHRISITSTIWHRRRYVFWERLMHELVHRHQMVFRQDDSLPKTFRSSSDNPKIKEEQDYYSNYDELEAYAHDAALEMLTWWKDLPYRQAMAASVGMRTPIASTYESYTSQFEPGHLVRTHFKRKLQSWYKVMSLTPEFYDRLALPKLV